MPDEKPRISAEGEWTSWYSRLAIEKKQRDRANYLIAPAAAAGIAVSFYGLLYSRRAEQEHLSSIQKDWILQKYINKTLSLEERFTGVEGQQNALIKTLQDLRSHSTQFATLAPADRQAVNFLIETEKSIDERLKSLEVALVTDPSKAFAVPLLRKEIEALQERERNDATNLDNAVGRLQTLMTTLFGSMLAVFTALGGISLWRSRKEVAPSQPPPSKAD
jgi:hypothetical protein